MSIVTLGKFASHGTGRLIAYRVCEGHELAEEESRCHVKKKTFENDRLKNSGCSLPFIVMFVFFFFSEF